MLRRTQYERPEKSYDQGLAAISETLNRQPVGCNFTIQTGGATSGNFILRVDRH